MAKYQLDGIDSIAEGACKLYELGGSKYLIYKLSDGYFATSAKCTHLFRSLAKGVIADDSTIRCPLHRAEFNIRNGEVNKWANFPPGVQLLNAVRSEKALSCFQVSEDDGQFYLNT